MEVYVKLKKDEIEKLWNTDCLNPDVKKLVEELFDMLLATDETIHVLRDGRYK